MLEEPTLTAKATAAAAREPGEPPSYEEYATAFRAHWVLCGSGFSHQLLAALSALKGEPRALVARTLAEFNSRDTMTLEAFSRFLTAFMDQYSPQMFMALFDSSSRQQKTFLESLLLLVFYEPLRDTMVRLCNELAGADAEPEVETLVGLSLLQLSPMKPVQSIRGRVSERLHQRVANDVETVRFSRMVFTCDLVTDLIHEKREGSLGFAMILSLSESGPSAEQLIQAALADLRELPTSFANEAYTLKVLNSLLQQTQCGCVTKAAFARASAAVAGQDAGDPTDQHSSGDNEDTVAAACTQGSPHEDLPLIWNVFLAHLPTLLSFFSPASPEASSLQWRFKPTHVQLVYIMLPVLNVSCTVADTLVIRTRTLDALLELIVRFPKASILHCAIARLFIVALEDSPYMFGKELPAFRSPTDPLRLHLLLGGALEFVLQAFGWTSEAQQAEASQAKKTSPPPAFLDVAISLDQALTSAFAQSAQLFMGNSAFERWKVFRLAVLLPVQTVWEEQYQPPPAVDMGPSPMLAAMLYGEGGHNQTQEDTPTDTKHHRDRKSSTDGITAALNAGMAIQITRPESPGEAAPSLKTGPEVNGPEAPTAALTEDAAKAQKSTQEGPCATVLISQPTPTCEASAPAEHDVPTPLAALYNEEEKRMMLKVSDDAAASSPPIALVLPAAVPQPI
jgi:hypothetical protein